MFPLKVRQEQGSWNTGLRHTIERKRREPEGSGPKRCAVVENSASPNTVRRHDRIAEEIERASDADAGAGSAPIRSFALSVENPRLMQAVEGFARSLLGRPELV